MANDRLWLIHKPSRLGILLAKHMGWGWYSNKDKAGLNHFFEVVLDECETQMDHDSFEIWRECEDARWSYSDERPYGLMKFYRVSDAA